MFGFLVAQALVERGMLDSIAAGITQMRYQIELYLGDGGSTYLLIGAVVIFLFFMTRRRR
jgi:hypothetical protein